MLCCCLLVRIGDCHWYRRSHDLRYTLKNRSTGDVFFVVVFTLVPKEDAEKENPAAVAGKKPEGEGKKEGEFEPKEDDLD